jgi:hypothetical protein
MKLLFSPCSDLTVTLTAFVKMFPRAFDKNILHFRCDNAGENKSFQTTLNEDMPYEIQFEYTAPYTPQQNGCIERKFATLYGKIRALTTASQLPQKLRNDLWPHAALLVTSLENTIVDQGVFLKEQILTGLRISETLEKLASSIPNHQYVIRLQIMVALACLLVRLRITQAMCLSSITPKHMQLYCPETFIG